MQRLMYGEEGETAIKLYLREIAQVPLLTREEEVKLARRIKRGDESARQQMIKANLRLVVKIAHDYTNCGLPLVDIVAEGNIGLMKAVEKFDPRKGGKLSTYAAWWIKQSIKRALANQSKTIRLPVHLVDKIARMRRISMQLAEELGREPTDEELASELGMTSVKVAKLRTAAIRPASLDAILGNEADGVTLGDMVSDEKAVDPADMMENSNLRGAVMSLLPTLEDREKKILSMRFGLDGRKEMTLEEVGEKFGVTRERIRQLQNTALKKLKKALEKKDRSRA